jgi:hypothetical protein
VVAEPYTEPSGAQNNYTLHKDTQHYGCILTQHNNKGRVALFYCNADCRYAHCRSLSVAILTTVMLGVILLSVESPYTEPGAPLIVFGNIFFDLNFSSGLRCKECFSIKLYIH